MSDTRLPPAAIHAGALPPHRGASYPPPHDEPCRTRARTMLGDLFGITDFGVNLLTLQPGGWSSQRHWHSSEDEFVYVLEGTPTLVTESGETRLIPGMCAGFPAGAADGHHLVNRSDRPVLLLEVGSRKPGDVVDYPDIDLRWDSAAERYSRKNGEPL